MPRIHDLHRWLFPLLCLLAVGCSKSRPAASPPPVADYRPEEGDVVFQSLNATELGAAIERATKSPYSHCGIVTKRGDMWVVLEAIGPVQETPLAWWILRGVKGKYDAFRLDEKYRDKIPFMIRNARAYEGRPYDIQYEFDDDKIYCSELVYKAFRQATSEELGRVVRLGDLDWKEIEPFIRKITGGDLPLDRRMITPADLARAPQLHQIYKN